MKINHTRRWLLAAAPMLALAACDKELDTMYTEVGEQIPTFVGNTLGLSTKYATGETFTFELQYAQQTSPLRDVRIYQRVEPATDSVLVQTIPYKAAFSKRKNADTLVVSYTVPAGANKANVRVSAVVAAENGQSKLRTFSFRLAEPTPTVRVNSVTNVTAPAGSPLVPGDVVRYNVVLNDGGINSATSLTTAGTLYKDLDSLITYVKVGTAPERRALRQRLPATGAQTGARTAVDVNVTLPAGSNGQEVTYRFEAKSRFAGTPSIRAASATAAPLTLGTTTPLAAARNLTLTYTGTTGGDQAAVDLTTFTLVPAAGDLLLKDLAITSTASNTVRLQALNGRAASGTTPAAEPTRFVKTTAAVYTAATLNSIRQTYLNAATTAQITTIDNAVVGDVYIARLRNTNQYAIFTVTGLSRTATEVTLALAVKAL